MMLFAATGIVFARESTQKLQAETFNDTCFGDRLMYAMH
jgi:hypothetical protein